MLHPHLAQSANVAIGVSAVVGLVGLVGLVLTGRRRCRFQPSLRDLWGKDVVGKEGPAMLKTLARGLAHAVSGRGRLLSE
jgi:hypothetical protein